MRGSISAKKSLSSFIFGTDAFLLSPKMSTRVLSYLVSPTDVSGLFDRVQISAGSVRLLIGNIRTRLSAWACEASCFANNPTVDLRQSLGQIEDRAPLRAVCDIGSVGRCELRRRELDHAKGERWNAHRHQRRLTGLDISEGRRNEHVGLTSAGIVILSSPSLLLVTKVDS
jgi:hypothetical protein